MEADGRWTAVEVRAPGGKASFGFAARAGCRYRITVRPLTLARPTLELDLDGRVVATVETAKPGADLVHDFDAERDAALAVRIGGFSAMTGSARLRVETVDPDGRPTAKHRRVLSEKDVLARVGELWIGESNRWDLLVEPGRTYEIRTRPGTAGPIALRVLDGAGEVLASTGGTADPYPTLAFEAPAARPAVLEVRSARGGGGTYGVLLRPASGAAPPAPPPVESPATAPAPTPARLEEEPLGFRLGSGDVAALFLARAPAAAPHLLQVREQDGWVLVPEATEHARGERSTARTPEGGAISVFRAHVPGTYRFWEPVAPAGDPVLLLHPAAEATGAPVLTGTGTDARVLAKTGSGWKPVGLAAVAPGGDYLFVAAGAGARDVGMRVVGLDGRALASRPAGDPMRTEVSGLGPSLRFRVSAPALVRLEVAGRGWSGYAVLRRASN